VNTPTAAAKLRATPVGATFSFTFINSMGGSVVTSNALYFLTKQGFQFTQAMNFLLGALLGVAYIAGALGAKRAIAALRRAHPGFSSRAILALLMVLLGSACLMPQVGAWLSPSGKPPPATVWGLVLFYSLGTGMLWPMVESYVSGGRSAGDLRSTMGRWNVVWSGAGLFITIIVTPLASQAAAMSIFCIGLAHFAALFPLLRFRPEPAAHLDGEHEPHPPVYADLLVTFRMLLPLAYLMMSAVGPYLPSLAEHLGLLRTWTLAEATMSIAVILPVSWIAARVATFWALSRWQGWHGRWYFAVVSGILLLAGFAAIVLAGAVRPAVGLPVALAGLAGFGLAVGSIYTAAIYYALEVGRSDVDAGGMHEALIGVGYTLGPGVGLAWTVAADRGMIAPKVFEPALLATVGGIALLTALAVAIRVRRHTAIS
jgi:hypothetical protein